MFRGMQVWWLLSTEPQRLMPYVGVGFDFMFVFAENNQKYIAEKDIQPTIAPSYGPPLTI